MEMKFVRKLSSHEYQKSDAWCLLFTIVGSCSWHLHVNLSLQYDLLWSNKSLNSENISLQLPQIKMSGLPRK